MPDRYANERYNRRTRALEKQANALARIADELGTRNLIETVNLSPVNTSGPSRSWTTERAKLLMKTITERTNRVIHQ